MIKNKINIFWINLNSTYHSRLFNVQKLNACVLQLVCIFGNAKCQFFNTRYFLDNLKITSISEFIWHLKKTLIHLQIIRTNYTQKILMITFWNNNLEFFSWKRVLVKIPMKWGILWSTMNKNHSKSNTTDSGIVFNGSFGQSINGWEIFLLVSLDNSACCQRALG